MFRQIGLDQTTAAGEHASSAARHLVQKLEGTLGGARVGGAKPQIGVDHANRGQTREMMALGHHLRADHDIDRTGLIGADDLAHFHKRGHQIGREQGDTSA